MTLSPDLDLINTIIAIMSLGLAAMALLVLVANLFMVLLSVIDSKFHIEAVHNIVSMFTDEISERD